METAGVVRRLGGLLLAALAAALLVELGRSWLQQVRAAKATRALFEAAQKSGSRAFEGRFTHPLADRYRPPGERCAEVETPLLRRYKDLAELEKAGDLRGLATVYALGCEPARAIRQLQELPPAPDVASDLAGLLLARRDDPAESMALLDMALRSRPGHPQALWNRALALAALDLPLAAGSSFRRVAALGEPGWSEEARRRADRLEGAAAARSRTYAAAVQAVATIARGVPPAREVIAAFPDLARAEFYRAAARLPPRERMALLPVAEIMDGDSGDDERSPLTAIARGAGDPAGMAALLEPPIGLERARAYQRLALATADRWQAIRSWQLVGVAAAEARQFQVGLAAFEQGLAVCRQHPFPEVCAEIKLAIARFRGDRYQLQAAQRLAAEARSECQRHDLPRCELRANEQLERIESVRTRRGLARAYAEENSLRGDDCPSAQVAHEQLAEIAQGEGNEAETRRQLAAVRVCDQGAPRFGRVGVGVLADLVRDPAGRTDRELGWFREALAAHRAGKGQPGFLDAARYQIYEGRALIEREPAHAEAVLEDVIARSEVLASGDDGVETVRMQALSTLIMAASRRSDHHRALELLARALRVKVPASCVVGTWARSTHRVYLARGPGPAGAGSGGGTVGLYRGNVLPSWRGPEADQDQEPPLPEVILRTVAGCPRVDVLATRPFLGQARLLPDDLAWGYLRHGTAAPDLPSAGAGPVRRLVVANVEAPVTLGLPRLGRHLTPVAGPGEVVEPLEGNLATPAEVLVRLPTADVVELHAHGIFEPTISDAPVVVLSPDQAASALLSARDIERVRLPRRPAVILGACEVARSAQYWSFQHSLPEAFMRAGARWVLASPAPVGDQEAGPFFEAVWRRARGGGDVAVALRDERRSPAWRRVNSAWIHQVVAFYQQERNER
jgi:hypothetical protein